MSYDDGTIYRITTRDATPGITAAIAGTIVPEPGVVLSALCVSVMFMRRNSNSFSRSSSRENKMGATLSD
jgi:predicted tellurium resistance membrane protein TerC